MRTAVSYFFAFLIFSQIAAAAGFGVSPASLDFVVWEGGSASKLLTIYNTGSAAYFAVAAGSVKAEPGSGYLESGGSAAVKVTASYKEEGYYADELDILLSSGKSNAVELAVGTTVPVSVTVLRNALSAEPVIGLLTSGSIVAAGLGSYFAARKLKPQTL